MPHDALAALVRRSLTCVGNTEKLIQQSTSGRQITTTKSNEPRSPNGRKQIRYSTRVAREFAGTGVNGTYFGCC